MSAGKGMGPTKGYQPALYRDNYDSIFKHNQPTHNMNTRTKRAPSKAEQELSFWFKAYTDCGDAAGVNDPELSSPEYVVSEITNLRKHAGQLATTVRLLEVAMEYLPHIKAEWAKQARAAIGAARAKT